MKLFISAGEPSGDLHGANLIRAIATRNPATTFLGFGGSKMEAAGARLLFPLADHAVMGFTQIVSVIPKMLGHMADAERCFRRERPDAVVLIDNPEFNMRLAKKARAAGVPVYYFVPPQLWAWRQGRVRSVRKNFAGVLSAFPFEHEWFESRHVDSHYIGHPYFDELAAQRLDAAFVSQERAKAGRIVALLPGSRTQEVRLNFASMLNAAKIIHTAHPETRFLVASFKESQAATVRAAIAGSGLPIEVHVGRTPEIIELAECSISVSGSVSLELMYRTKPSAIVFRMDRLSKLISDLLVKVKWASLVNLLSGEEIFPEFVSSQDESKGIARQILSWLDDPQAHAKVVEKLVELRARVAVPGACERAADYLSSRLRLSAIATPRAA